MALTAADASTREALRPAGDVPRGGERDAERAPASGSAGGDDAGDGRVRDGRRASEDGDAIAAAMQAEADAIVAEAVADHGALVDAGVGAPRRAATTRPAAGPRPRASGTLAGGQFGTALDDRSPPTTRAPDPRRSSRGRPGFTGSRVGCWELAAAGVPHMLVAERGRPSLIAAGEIDAVLVPAERVAANGESRRRSGRTRWPSSRPGAACRSSSAPRRATVDPRRPTAPRSARGAAGRERPRRRGTRIAPEGTPSATRARRTPAAPVTATSPRTALVRRCGRSAAVAARRATRPALAAPAAAERPRRRTTAPAGVRPDGDRRRRHRGAAPGRAATTDRAVLRGFLERDRLLRGLRALRPRGPRVRADALGRATDGGELVAIVLEYSGMTPQPMFVDGRQRRDRGDPADVIRPRAAYLAALPESCSAVATQYRVDPGAPMVRMWVDRATFRPVPGGASGGCCRSRSASSTGSTSWGSPRGCRRAPSPRACYYGIRVNGRLVAAAGTHVVSRTARLAVVGNVLTHTDYRGRGYAKAVTGAVTAELLRYCDEVVLNVRSDNPPALQAYSRLGYAGARPVRGAPRPPPQLAVARPDGAVPPLLRRRPPSRAAPVIPDQARPHPNHQATRSPCRPPPSPDDAPRDPDDRPQTVPTT